MSTRKELAIIKSEEKIAKIDARMFEDWYTVGMELLAIKSQFIGLDKKPPFGLKSWEAYCRSDRTEYGRAHSDRLIQAAKTRILLPEIPAPIGGDWSEGSVRPLTELKAKSTSSAVTRTATEIVKECKRNGVKLTAKVVEAKVKEVLDTPREQRRRAKKAENDLAQTTLVKNLNRVIENTRKLQSFFEKQDEESWAQAEEESPGVADRAAHVVAEFAMFLKEG